MFKKGTLICFIGIDGSGKTTHAKNLEKYLKTKRKSCKYLWCGWRQFEFFLFRPVIEFVKILNKRKQNNNMNLMNKEKENNNMNLMNKEKENNNIFEFLHYFAMFDYILRVIPSLFSSLYRYDYIIADRYIFDVIVGFSVNNPENIFKKIFWIFPKPNMIFYIDISERIAYSRKDDIPSIEYLQKRKSIYNEFMINYNAKFLDGSKSIEEISRAIQKAVIN